MQSIRGGFLSKLSGLWLSCKLDPDTCVFSITTPGELASTAMFVLSLQLSFRFLQDLLMSLPVSLGVAAKFFPAAGGGIGKGSPSRTGWWELVAGAPGGLQQGWAGPAVAEGAAGMQVCRHLVWAWSVTGNSLFPNFWIRSMLFISCLGHMSNQAMGGGRASPKHACVWCGSV